ncbi:MAG: S8 family serine peptidase [Proteobacteria bacterium]|nr:S8 family serine peptidase [Pseudomonadota bacterium]
MGRTIRIVIGLLTVVAAIYVLRPRPAERFLPTPTLEAAPDKAGVLVVDLVDNPSDEDLQTIEMVIGNALSQSADLEWISELSKDEGLAEGWVSDLDDAVAALQNHPLIEVVEPAIQYGLPYDEGEVVSSSGASEGFPNDPMFEKQWNMVAMGAPAGWASSARGKGIIVAVIDTGVSKVEDLEGTELLQGATFVPRTSSSADDQGHGTHVAGTIAQTTNNGKGVAGVAPQATILPVKVLSKHGYGSSSWIAAGIDYAVDEGADVINLSLGGPYSFVIHNAIRKARKKGVIVVAAAGNSGRRGVGYPGGLRETIGVSAIGPDGSLAFYSSYGKGVDIAAPGGDKRKPGGGVLQDTINAAGGHHYVEYQGTSMATPHVAGAVAVLLSTGAPPDQVEQMLLKSAVGDGKWNEKYGYGKLSISNALKRTVDHHGSTRFFIGVLFALLVSQLAGAYGTFRTSAAAFAGVTAGGLFFLSWFALPDWTIINLISSGLLTWPAVLLGPSWMHFPLWLSALLPAVVAFTLGATRGTRPLALGLCCGVAAHMFHGAATGALEPLWLPVALGQLWLTVNGTLCIAMAMALAGVEKLDEEAK